MKQLGAGGVLLSGMLLVVTLFLFIQIDLNSASAQSEREPEKVNSTNKVLIVVTSHNVLGKTGFPTGVWLPEMTHPYYALKNAGFEIDIATPKGGNVPIDPVQHTILHLQYKSR